MSRVLRPVARDVLWFALLTAIAIATLGVFWILLSQRFSPETFEAASIMPYTIELVWFGGALAAAVCALVVAARRPSAWRTLALGATPLTIVAVLVLAKELFRAPIRTYDMMLFCVACGWTLYRWTRDRPEAVSGAVRPLRVAVWSIVLALAAYQFWQQVQYLNDLALGYADCGENARLMFNTMTNPHELFLRVNPDKPLFYDHFYPGILPFMPLWLLWPALKLTIVLQIVSVFGVAVPLYFIGKQTFRNERSAWLLVLAWLFYPSTSQFIYSASYGFRWGNVCLLFYFVALACWLNSRRGWALTMAVWAVLIKEEAAILVGMFGVYLVLFERKRLSGTALTALGFGSFLLITSVLVPAISGGSYSMTRFFYDLGHSKWEILLAPIAKPRIFCGRLFEPSSFYFATALLAPLLFLPVRKASVLFIGSLTFVFCCMNPILKNISFHYQASLLPVVFWAFVSAVKDWSVPRRLNALTAVVVTCAIFSIFIGAQPWSKATLPIHPLRGRIALVRRFGERIDRRGTLFATQRVAAHFVTQRYLYLDPPVPEQTDYALLDLRDSWRGSVATLEWLERTRRIQREVEANPHLHLVDASDGLLLYSRAGAALDPQTLVERDALPDSLARSDFDLGGVRIVGFSITPLSEPSPDDFDRVKVTTFSTVIAPTNLDLAVMCILHFADEGLTSEFQPLGQGVWPIVLWKTNKFYIDDFIVPVPHGQFANATSISFDVVTLSP
jgi:uncharacterized membrane protein